MSLPNIKDQVRINPPWASVVVGRTPMIQWHATKTGARRSALGYSNTRYGDESRGEDRYKQFATQHVGIATINDLGDLIYVSKWTPGQEIERG